MIKKLLLFFLFFNTIKLFSAFEYKSPSAQSSSLAEIKTVIDPEPEAIFFNSSLLPDKRSLGTFYSDILNIKELANSSISTSYPFKLGTFAIGFMNFGDTSLYIERTFALGYKIQHKNCNFGITFKNLQLEIAEMQEKGSYFSMDIAGNFKYNNFFSFGICLLNFTRTKIGKYYKEELFSDINFGLKYTPSKNIDFFYEITKENDYKKDEKIATQITLFAYMKIRCGFSKNIDAINLGFGIKNIFDYALKYHFVLGQTHIFTLNLYF